jgi:endonuclease III related protein
MSSRSMRATRRHVSRLYAKLLKRYGPQGWWPLLELEGGRKPTKKGSTRGYHPGDYSYPKTAAQRFEICVGAILTQNTAWTNVEKALLALKKKRLLDPCRIVPTETYRLEEAVRPAGYFRQKARKLKIFSKCYVGLKGDVPGREQLLALWGIGPETADSILLYAYKVPTFVVDAYTRRVFLRDGIVREGATYDDIKVAVEASLPRRYEVYQEFHALIVEEGKNL